ncbi:MAG: sigma-70 family RNA polymerase sigma factor [Christensenellales bacterium]
MKEEIELLRKAKTGSQEAINEIMSLRKNLVVSIARKYYLMGGDKEDLIQEGMIGLFKAITYFDESKNDNFASFAVTIIEHEIINAIRKANSGSQQFLSESILLSDDEVLSSDELTPENNFISEESTVELTNEIYDKLSKFERLVVDYYLKGYSYTDIAKLLGKPSKVIDNALTRIKKKLEYLKERL